MCSLGIALEVSKSQKRRAGQHWKVLWSIFITPVGIMIERILKLIPDEAYGTCSWSKAVDNKYVSTAKASQFGGSCSFAVGYNLTAEYV